MAVLVKISPESTRDDLLICLASYNAKAKAESRRGYVGTQTTHYANLHDTMSALVEALRGGDYVREQLPPLVNEPEPHISLGMD